MRIIFIGTGEIGLPALHALSKVPEHHVLAVVTQPDRAQNRLWRRKNDVIGLRRAGRVGFHRIGRHGTV